MSVNKRVEPINLQLDHEENPKEIHDKSKEQKRKRRGRQRMTTEEKIFSGLLRGVIILLYDRMSLQWFIYVGN